MKDAGSIVKVTRNYQVTIPSNIRLKADIKEGSLVKVVYDEKEGVIKLIPFKRKRLTIRLERKITVEEIEETIEKALNEVTAWHEYFSLRYSWRQWTSWWCIKDHRFCLRDFHSPDSSSWLHMGDVEVFRRSWIISSKIHEYLEDVRARYLHELLTF